MGDWRLIALDMDGTLMLRDETISDENRTWLERARAAGIEVTIATGRPLEGVVASHAQALGLCMPLVTVNGGEVWGSDGELLHRRALNAGDVVELHQLCAEMGAHFWARTTERFVRDGEFPDDAGSEMWLKFGYYSDAPGVMDTIWHRLSDDERFETTNSGTWNIEVNAAGVTKAAGLEVVCGRYGIDKSQVITMGDSMNDLSMLRWAGLGIAMGNAQPVVKEVADCITEDCESHGVARAIERILTRG